MRLLLPPPTSSLAQPAASARSTALHYTPVHDGPRLPVPHVVSPLRPAQAAHGNWGGHSDRGTLGPPVPAAMPAPSAAGDLQHRLRPGGPAASGLKRPHLLPGHQEGQNTAGGASFQAVATLQQQQQQQQQLGELGELGELQPLGAGALRSWGAFISRGKRMLARQLLLQEARGAEARGQDAPAGTGVGLAALELQVRVGAQGQSVL